MKIDTRIRRTDSSPTVHPLHIGPDTLGTCDECGEPQPMTGHLYKQPDGSYNCPDCDIIHATMFKSCADIGTEV